VTWVSKTGAAKILSSGAESAVTLNVNRQKDNIQEALSAGGEIALKVGYLGTTATLTIDDNTLSITRARVEPEATSASASRTSRRSAMSPRSSTARPATKPMSARRSSANFRPRRWTMSRPSASARPSAKSLAA
jgi:hypothetical protein